MSNHINLVSYNIHHGSKAGEIIKNILSLAAQGVNIFCLQEVHQHKDKEFIVEVLLKALGTAWQAEYLIKPSSFDLGLCTLWKTKELEAVSFEHLLLPKISKANLREKIIYKIVVEHVHPVQRAALIGNFKLNGKTLRITNVHLDWHGGLKQKILQLESLRLHLEAQPKAAHEITCGDFNTLGFYRLAEKQTEKIRNILGEDFESAFHNQATTSYLQMLDQIFVKNLSLIKAEILKYAGSDHFPLLAEVKM